MNKPRNKPVVDDDRWKMKGGPHEHNKKRCGFCRGLGYKLIDFPRRPGASSIEDCENCNGTGYV